jgi:hypothetical protein
MAGGTHSIGGTGAGAGGGVHELYPTGGAAWMVPLDVGAAATTTVNPHRVQKSVPSSAARPQWGQTGTPGQSIWRI